MKRSTDKRSAPPRTPSGPRSCRPTSGSGAWTSRTARRPRGETPWRRSRPRRRSRWCRAERSARWQPGALEGPRAGLGALRLRQDRPGVQDGGFSAQQRAAVARPRPRAARRKNQCIHCRAVRRRSACRSACASAAPARRPARRRVDRGPERAHEDHLAAADLRELPFLDTPRRGAPPPVPDFTAPAVVTESPALVFSPRAATSRSTWRRRSSAFLGSAFLAPPPHTRPRAPPSGRKHAAAARLRAVVGASARARPWMSRTATRARRGRSMRRGAASHRRLKTTARGVAADRD